MRTEFLQETLAKESRAYGFTIAFWGSGAMLIQEHGLPLVNEALLYGLGAVIGFGILTLYAYRSPLGRVNYNNSEVMALGMVHYFAALIPVVAAYYLADLSSSLAFFSTGIATSILYNTGIIAEEYLTEEAEKLEEILKKD